MSTKLIFRSGLNTIGGTIVEVINSNDRLIFDFGTVFDPANEDVELKPEVEGIYDNTSEFNDTVLISHLHLDHTKAMNLIDKNIDIYMSVDSQRFLNDLYKIDFNGFMGQRRNYKGVEFNKPFSIGNFEITFMSVDHDVIGASAILIETDDLTLFYSGDIRLHGLNSQATYNTIDYIKNLDKQIDVAIFEGVTISFIEDDYEIIPSNIVEEDGYEEDFVSVIGEQISPNNLILANPYIMSYERLKSIFSLANSLNKVVCLTDKFAYLASKYLRNYDYHILDKDSYNVGAEVIAYSELNKHHLAIFDFSNRDKYLTAINSNPTTLIQTGGEPLGAYDPNWLLLEKYCNENEIDFIYKGSSGHGAPEHILFLIEEVNPKFLIPLHSFKPELLKSKKKSIKQLLPEKDCVYEFINHTLV